MALENAHMKNIVLTLTGLLALLLAGCGGAGAPNFTDSGGGVLTPAIEQFPDEGRNHIDPSVTPVYNTEPPTSGPHYPTPTKPGFYTTEQRPGHLVHALEHGNVVIYYDPARVTQADIESLKALASRNQGDFDGVVVTPRTDPRYPIIVTAWRAMLRLDAYDPAQINAVVDIFLGRGPENPNQ